MAYFQHFIGGKHNVFLECRTVVVSPATNHPIKWRKYTTKGMHIVNDYSHSVSFSDIGNFRTDFLDDTCAIDAQDEGIGRNEPSTPGLLDECVRGIQGSGDELDEDVGGPRWGHRPIFHQLEG